MGSRGWVGPTPKRDDAPVQTITGWGRKRRGKDAYDRAIHEYYRDRNPPRKMSPLEKDTDGRPHALLTAGGEFFGVKRKR